MKKSHRIWAVIGLVLACVSVVCMILSPLFPVYSKLLLGVSVLGTLTAVAILMLIGAARKRAQQPEEPTQE